MTEAEAEGEETPREPSREHSGRRVHITCVALALIGGGAGLMLASGSVGEFLGVILLIIALWSWGWYSGPWRTFVHTGQPGWLSLVPLYNGFILLEVTKKPGWWTLLWLVPGAQLFVGVQVLRALSARFRRSPVLPVLLFLATAAPFYLASKTWVSVGVSQGMHGKYGALVSMGIKAFILGVHVSILFGCLPFGLGKHRPADTD